MLFGIIFWFIDMRKNLTQKEKMFLSLLIVYVGLLGS